MKKILTILTAFALLFTACVKDGGDGKETGGNSLKMIYPKTLSNEGENVSSARLQYGLASDTSFAGILHPLWYEGIPDAVVMQFFVEPLYFANKDRNFIQGKEGERMAWYEMSDDLLTKTIHIKDGVKWHDGEAFTADDIIFAMKVLADPDYTGVRFIEPYTNIEGIMDYNEGKADDISGVKKIDDSTVEITYTKATDDFLYAQEYYLPEHLFKDIPVKDMAQSAPVRTNPVGAGPFKVAGMVPGESIRFDAFEDYHLGTPKIAGVDLKVVSPNVVNEALKSGDLDMVSSYPTTGYSESNLGDNTTMLQTIDTSYNYVGFKLGKYDNENNKVVPDPNAKMADVELRRAIGYSANNPDVATGLYDDLRMPANSIIIPPFASYYNADLEGFKYNPEKAKEILDEAGYKDTDGDGFRENPKGEKLVINAAFMSGANAEKFAETYLQGWREVGLDVRLIDDRLMEFNLFYDKVKEDDPSIDIYSAAWGTGYNPNPTGLYGPTSMFNYTRYTDDEMIELFEKINSDEALNDMEYKKELYNDWQQMMFEKAIAIPTLYRTSLTPVNNRIKEWSVEYGTSSKDGVIGWHLLELTSDKPVKDGEK